MEPLLSLLYTLTHRDPHTHTEIHRYTDPHRDPYTATLTLTVAPTLKLRDTHTDTLRLTDKHKILHTLILRDEDAPKFAQGLCVHMRLSLCGQVACGCFSLCRRLRWQLCVCDCVVVLGAL